MGRQKGHPICLGYCVQVVQCEQSIVPVRECGEGLGLGCRGGERTKAMINGSRLCGRERGRENAYACMHACTRGYMCACSCLRRVWGPVNWEEERREFSVFVRRLAENQSVHSKPWPHPREKQ